MTTAIDHGDFANEGFRTISEYAPPSWDGDLEIVRAGRATIARFTIDTDTGPRGYTGAAIRHPDDCPDDHLGAMLAIQRACAAAAAELDVYATVRIRANDQRNAQARHKALVARANEITELLEAVTDTIEALNEDRTDTRLNGASPERDPEWDQAIRHGQILAARLERTQAELMDTWEAAYGRHQATPTHWVHDPDFSHTHGSEDGLYDPACQACDHLIGRI